MTRGLLHSSASPKNDLPVDVEPQGRNPRVGTGGMLFREYWLRRGSSLSSVPNSVSSAKKKLGQFVFQIIG